MDWQWTVMRNMDGIDKFDAISFMGGIWRRQFVVKAI